MPEFHLTAFVPITKSPSSACVLCFQPVLPFPDTIAHKRQLLQLLGKASSHAGRLERQSLSTKWLYKNAISLLGIQFVNPSRPPPLCLSPKHQSWAKRKIVS